MFRSKKDVDRHVQNIFSKLRNENEKNLRCYNVAKLYYQVGDYESARRYVSSYLEVRDNSASAHKLLGQANEALGQKEVAFNEYKISLELEGRQDDLVLKVCELLVDTDMGMDANKTRYWAERADKQFPHHPTVFQLKEKLLTLERPNNNSEDLEALIASELTARPTDVQLRVKLLRHYMSKHKLDTAYEHAINVEATFSHRNSIAWYQMLCELLAKCKEIKYSDWSFWILYISALERYTALCMKEQGNEIKKSVPEATQAVFNFDQNLNEIKLKNFSEYYSVFMEHVFTHMWGQLHFHLACLLLRKTKREQGSWSEAGRLCAPLLLTALHVTPIDSTATWTIHVKDQFKNQIDLWYREGSYRCSQAGHVLQDYARDDMKKLMDRIDKFCTGQWRERIYQRIFVSRIHLDYIRNSYFCNCSVPNSPLRLCCQSELKHYDEVAERMWPDSLHHQVWLGIKNRNSQNKDGPQPHQYSHLFPELQFSVYNSNQAAPDSLSQLDIDAFLNAATLCSSVILEEQQLNSFLSPEKLPTLPADLTTTLCTCNQEKWWSAAYKMYSKQKDVEENIGEIRQELQQGLEVIRCIGNHGLHPVLLVHLARIFQYRAKMLKEKDEEHGDIPALEAFSELYWSTVVPLLERLQNNQTIRTLTSKLFNYQGKEMNNIELTNALEEGRLLLAQTFVRDKQYEQAIEALQVLKCPDASFQQGQIYKMFADEIVNSMPGESLTSEMRSQHVIMLSKARNCFYLTLDRLRSPGINPKHPLNSELGTYITEIENELKRIDPDLGRNDLSRNDCDVISDESYSPAHSTVEQTVPNPPALTTLAVSHILSTPQRTTNRTPKQTSTPCKPQHQDILELSKNRTEARPSPERLDAQIRQIMHTRDNEMQELTELMKGMMDQIKTLTYKMDNLAKEVTESRKENQKQQQRVQQANINPTIEDDFYVLGEDEYADLNYSNQTGAAPSISGNIFTPTHRHPYPPLVYPSATAFQGYYQSGIPFSDPNVQATIPSLYPHNMYPMPVLYPNRSKVSDSLLQQNLFASRLPQQLPDLMPPTNTSLQMSVQKINDSTKSEIKDAPVNKVLPINVVITTSDTVPTTAPVVQPTLSVTIPPQYRLGTSSTLMTTMITPTTVMTMAAVTTMTTMTMATGSSYTAPHCYQISMPLEATIPTTVNLPPLPATLTTTSANIAMPDMYQVPNKNNQNIHLTESPNTSTEIYDTEHDPIPDFVPVIPLPAEVKVTTGEEDEIILYCARAKLFRFVDKEWKERGVGYVKLLQNAEGKVRLLMRRDQVLKICANHMLRPEMELTAMMNNNKAWCWVANDFADEEVKLEKLCIRFKTIEEALSFKECFDNAKLNSTSSMKKLSEISKVMSKSSGIDASKLEKSNQQVNTTAATDVVISNISKTSATVTLGGFSFTSQPIIQKISDVATASELMKPEEPVRASPFRGFSFTKSTDKSSETAIGIITTTNISASSTSFTFATTTAPVKTSQSNSINQNAVSTASVLTSRASSLDNNSSSQTILRRPRLPPPGATKTEGSDSVESKVLQIENEQSLFDGKVNLLHQNNDNKQWENKATGMIKLLLDMKSKKLRFLIVDEENSKILYGHSIPLNTKFIFKSDSAIVNWIVSEEDKERNSKSKLLYSANFQTMEMASQFNNIVSIYQQKLNEGCSASEIMTELEKKTPFLSNKNKDQNAAINKHQLPLSELFKPPTGSWECDSCYTRNKATDLYCMACEAASSLVVSNKSTSINTSKSDDSNKPLLSELFKPPIGSWTCSACYVINLATNDYCIACNIPKNSQLSKSQMNTFQVNSPISSTAPLTTFTFGVPKDTTKEAGTGFIFRLPKPEEKRIDDNTKSALIKSGETGTKFIFGVPVKSNTPVSSENSPFTFGSPAKIDFHFTAKSPTKSSVEAGENSEEEVVESDDIHFSPIIPLPDKIEVKTGEEEEEVLYSHRAKLFRFDTTVKEWKERGLGDIKLLCHKETGKLRLIMRRDHVLKLCLNHLLSTNLEFTPKDEKTWLWNAADYSEGEIEYMQFACRFKTSEIAECFKKAIDNARNSIELSGNNIIKNEPKTKAQTIPAQEIEILYETKVTLEEKAAALNLQLPENFYAYKQKKDCPGCRGCREPGIILYADNVLQKSQLITKSDTTSQLSSSVITSTSANGVRITEPSSVAVKNGSLFPVSGTMISKPLTTTASSIFDGSTMSFGTADLKLFNEKKSTTFSFGMHPQFNANETIEKSLSNEQSASLLENIKICSPNANTPFTMNSNTVGIGKSVFGNITSTASTFNTTTFSLSPEKDIFSNISNSSFVNTSSSSSNQSNIPSLTSTLNSWKTTTVLPTNIPNTSSPILNITATTDPLMITIQQNSKTNDTNTITTSTTAFPMSNQSTNSLFVMTSTPSYFPKTTFDNSTSVFGNFTTTTTSTVANTFNSKALETIQEDNNTFFPSNNMTFSALAAQATQREAFKVDPNFSFAGAGSSVFGSKSVASSLNSSSRVQNKSISDSIQKDDNEEDDGEADSEHDPHFEPIIPLPDVIEVRTGEEDEEKVFCQRAKLYRYDNSTKEWKERGVGDMKILYHAVHGSYRLLLRRDQVYKVVCNFLLTSDVEFHPLSTSKQAWMWAGMNHAEQEPCIEQLAIKFKSVDLACQFKENIDKIQQILREKENQGNTCINETNKTENDRDDVDEDEEDEDEEDEEEEDNENEDDNEDYQEGLPIVEKRATVYFKLPNETQWQLVGLGNLVIHYDSEIYAERIILKVDDSEECASNTIISMETVMKVEGKECIWTAIDYALIPPKRRVLKAVFSSIQAAHEVHTFFEEGLDTAKQAGVVEYDE